MVHRFSDSMSSSNFIDRVLPCKVSEECCSMSFSSVKAFQSHQKTHKSRKLDKTTVKRSEKKISTAASARDLLNSFSSVNVKVSTEPQNGNEPQNLKVGKTQKSVSRNVVVSQYPPSQKKGKDISDSETLKLKPPKSRKTKTRKEDTGDVRTNIHPSSVPPVPATRKFSIPCHCSDCLPCGEECCDNPVVRSGQCCDPGTLGQCLQPLKVGYEMLNPFLLNLEYFFVKSLL